MYLYHYNDNSQMSGMPGSTHFCDARILSYPNGCDINEKAQ